jgi:ribosomal protein S18 acetylase RimI-like enzyme
VYDETAIKILYEKNEWTNYTKDIDRLYKGIKNSINVYAAYDDEKLIGLIRSVGDDETIIYIQDILIDPKYQGMKIGSRLIEKTVLRFKHVRQILLSTDNSPKLIRFYENNNFIQSKNMNIVSFIYNK